MNQQDAVAAVSSPPTTPVVEEPARGVARHDRRQRRAGLVAPKPAAERVSYPRPGEPIVPRLLRPLVIERRPVSHGDSDTELLARVDLGPVAWMRLPPETCRRLSMLVVDRVQTRLHTLPALVLNHSLPHPRIALTLPIERRTANTIRRELPNTETGSWTIERYIGLRRFGGRALVDLLAAIEARGGADIEPSISPSRVSAVSEFQSEIALDRALAAITRRLPISEAQANAELLQERMVDGPIDLSQLARTAVQLGRNAPFHVIEVGGSRMAARLSDLTAARAAYRIAVRAVRGWGTAPIRAVVAQLRAVVQSSVAASFVERLLCGISSFRWLDRADGWFWFAHQRNPLLNDLRKVFSVARRVPLARLWSALFRTRLGPLPSPEAVREICAAVPGARIDRGAVTIDRPFARAAYLSDSERRVASILESAPQGLSGSQMRGKIRALGLPWTPVWHLLRHSPLVESAPNGLYQLVGSAA